MCDEKKPREIRVPASQSVAKSSPTPYSPHFIVAFAVLISQRSHPIDVVRNVYKFLAMEDVTGRLWALVAPWALWLGRRHGFLLEGHPCCLAS